MPKAKAKGPSEDPSHVMHQRNRYTVEETVNFIRAYDERKERDGWSQIRFLESIDPAVIKATTFSDWLKCREKLFEKLGQQELGH
jgi:hypothetical protein